MIFLLHATESDRSIAGRMGLADYSYYFVMKRFVPVLEHLGEVRMIDDPAAADALVAELQRRGKEVVLLSFSPPQRVPQDLRCPTLPVFAWEYSTLPSESWAGDARHNWTAVLRSLPAAITHSEFAVRAVHEALGANYPIVSLPAPLWDDYETLCNEAWLKAYQRTWRLDLPRGVILDSQALGLDAAVPDTTPSFHAGPCSVSLGGLVYTAVFNPNDGRKNWHDLISAFCFAFRDDPDATLLMKLVYHDAAHACQLVWTEMRKLAPYRCRVVAVHGFLDDGTYRHLVAHSTYVVNSAHGEGQCLPLMEFMSAGKPAIAPDHTAMADYLTPDNAFIIRSGEEWTHWPHDPRMVLRTMRYRLDWESLRDASRESGRIVREEPQRYAAMSHAAHETLRQHCSQASITTRLGEFLRARGYHPARWPRLRHFLQRSRRRLSGKKG